MSHYLALVISISLSGLDFLRKQRKKESSQIQLFQEYVTMAIHVWREKPHLAGTGSSRDRYNSDRPTWCISKRS
jgi:hypothetical protein